MKCGCMVTAGDVNASIPGDPELPDTFDTTLSTLYLNNPRFQDEDFMIKSLPSGCTSDQYTHSFCVDASGWYKVRPDTPTTPRMAFTITPPTTDDRSKIVSIIAGYFYGYDMDVNVNVILLHELYRWSDLHSHIDIRRFCTLIISEVSYCGWTQRSSRRVILKLNLWKFVRCIIDESNIGKTIVMKKVKTLELLPYASVVRHRHGHTSINPSCITPCISAVITERSTTCMYSPRMCVDREPTSWFIAHFDDPTIAMRVHENKHLSSDAAVSIAISELSALPNVLLEICQSYIIDFAPHRWMLSVI